jgi:hypothetical protein
VCVCVPPPPPPMQVFSLLLLFVVVAKDQRESLCVYTLDVQAPFLPTGGNRYIYIYVYIYKNRHFFFFYSKLLKVYFFNASHDFLGRYSPFFFQKLGFFTSAVCMYTHTSGCLCFKKRSSCGNIIFVHFRFWVGGKIPSLANSLSS